MNKKDIKFGLLDEINLPDFMTLYKKFYKEVEGKEMTEKHAYNYFFMLSKLLNSPDCLFICVYDKDKIIGILGIRPMFTLDDKKSCFVEPVYILPEYRKYAFIAKELIKAGIYWIKQRKIEVVYGSERYDKNIWEKKKKFMNFKVYEKLLKWEVNNEK